MSTWVGAIIETVGRTDFWDVARKHGVDATTQDIPKYVLIDCDVGFDFDASVRLAEAMSRDLGTTAIGFVVQTTADVHEVHAFSKGTAIRQLAYLRDNDGWCGSRGRRNRGRARTSSMMQPLRPPTQSAGGQTCFGTTYRSRT
jgi:hypothetical protein